MQGSHAYPESTRARARAAGRVGIAQVAVRVLVYALLIAGATVTLYPFAFMLAASFKSQSEIFSLPPSLLPRSLRLDGYQKLLTEKPFLTWFFNSVVVVGMRLAISLFLCSLAGFAFAKFEFPLKRALFITIIASIMIPFESLYIPMYIVMSQLGLVNTLPALFLPWAASGFGIFLMRQYMVGIPSEMIDAARVDGASGFRIYWQIALPLARPALGALTIVLYLATWTSFFWPLIILTRPNTFTLPLGIASLLAGIEREEYWETAMAAAVLAALPLIAVFVAMQRQFLAGLTIGSVKG